MYDTLLQFESSGLISGSTWLTIDEIGCLEALRRRVIEGAQNAPNLDELLGRLGDALLSALSHFTTANFSPPDWRQLGFQSNNPRTDLRTGRLALEAMLYLAERYPLAVGQMVREAQCDALDYPFAVASINVTQYLIRYLSLADNRKHNGKDRPVAPQDFVKRFAKLLVDTGTSNVDPFCEFHAAVMSSLHATWRTRKAAQPELTMLDFLPALEDTMTTVHAFCTDAALESIWEFHALHANGLEDEQSVVSTETQQGMVSTETQQGILGFRLSFRHALKTVSESASLFGTYIWEVFKEQ